jgi:hypothetical protein
MASASPSEDVGTTITAALSDGPLRGKRAEAQIIEGRPSSTIDVPGKDGTMCRYCLAHLTQSGTSAVYTFLYHV